MMIGYSHIRIDRDTLIKTPTRTDGMGDSINLYFDERFDPEEKPMTIGGEMAAALRDWISGNRTFPVTPNGILNLYGAMVEGLTAARALGGDKLTDVIVDAEQYFNAHVAPGDLLTV